MKQKVNEIPDPKISYENKTILSIIIFYIFKTCFNIPFKKLIKCKFFKLYLSCKKKSEAIITSECICVSCNQTVAIRYHPLFDPHQVIYYKNCDRKTSLNIHDRI